MPADDEGAPEDIGACTSESTAVPDQRTLTLVNAYVARTAKLLNQFAAVSERKLHEADVRMRELETSLRLLEFAVDSAVESQSAPELDEAPPAPRVDPPASSAPSTQGSGEWTVEEFNAEPSGYAGPTGPMSAQQKAAQDRTEQFQEGLQRRGAPPEARGPSDIQPQTGL